jgi:hypothetical protein
MSSHLLELIWQVVATAVQGAKYISHNVLHELMSYVLYELHSKLSTQADSTTARASRTHSMNETQMTQIIDAIACTYQ